MIIVPDRGERSVKLAFSTDFNYMIIVPPRRESSVKLKFLNNLNSIVSFICSRERDTKLIFQSKKKRIHKFTPKQCKSSTRWPDGLLLIGHVGFFEVNHDF